MKERGNPHYLTNKQTISLFVLNALHVFIVLEYLKF